jgi:hypothetical protein
LLFQTGFPLIVCRSAFPFRFILAGVHGDDRLGIAFQLLSEIGYRTHPVFLLFVYVMQAGFQGFSS